VSSDESSARREVADALRYLDEQGLNFGTAGNVSVRTERGYMVSPSALAPRDVDAHSVVELDIEGEPLSGGIPTTEWRIHRDLYAEIPTAQAIVHMHSTYATALASLREDLPPFHYMIGKAGGDVIRCATYATYGSQELSDNVIEALGDRRACLMANHGMIAYADSMAKALTLAVEVESLCRQYLIARAAGTPVLLTDEQMAEARAKLARYGTPASRD
jgi:L-fuculose-phosphate aldolase